MTAITEEATEKQQRVSAETRPVSGVQVPSPRDSTGTAAQVTLVSGIVDLYAGSSEVERCMTILTQETLDALAMAKKWHSNWWSI